MSTQTNSSLRVLWVSIFLLLTFATAGFAASTESSVIAQNESGVNQTGTANKTALYTNETVMVPETQR
jgi:hypothetical protein